MYINNRPTLEVETIKDKGDVISFSGTSMDSGGVVMVVHRLDEGNWTKIVTDGPWSFNVSKEGLSPGEHTVDIKAADWETFSETFSTNFTIRGDGGEEDPSMVPYIIIVGIVIILAVTGTVFYWRHRSTVR
jgi:hypothetical protein